MLLLKGQQARWETHAPSGARFKINPINTAQHDQIKRDLRKADGALEMMAYGKAMANAALADWEKVGSPEGELPCTEENRALFVQNVGDHLMNWVIDHAIALHGFITKEADEAKKD